MSLIGESLFEYKMIFQILKLHLLHLVYFDIELESNAVYIFIMAGDLFQFFIDARLDLIQYLLLIIRVL